MRAQSPSTLGIHDERYVSAKEAADVIPLLPAMFDEPFGDSSAIPTFIVSRFAREHVKVVLSGDGGDELFAGYRRYRQMLAVWRTIRHIPMGARRAGAALIGRIPFGFWTGMDSVLGICNAARFQARSTRVCALVRRFALSTVSTRDISTNGRSMDLRSSARRLSNSPRRTPASMPPMRSG